MNLKFTMHQYLPKAVAFEEIKDCSGVVEVELEPKYTLAMVNITCEEEKLSKKDLAEATKVAAEMAKEFLESQNLIKHLNRNRIIIFEQKKGTDTIKLDALDIVMNHLKIVFKSAIIEHMNDTVKAAAKASQSEKAKAEKETDVVGVKGKRGKTEI